MGNLGDVFGKEEDCVELKKNNDISGSATFFVLCVRRESNNLMLNQWSTE